MNLTEQLAIQAMYDAQAKADEPKTEEVKQQVKRRAQTRKVS